MERTTKENPLSNENMNQARYSLLNTKFLGEYAKQKSFPKGNKSIAELTIKGTGGRSASYLHSEKKL